MKRVRKAFSYDPCRRDYAKRYGFKTDYGSYKVGHGSKRRVVKRRKPLVYVENRKPKVRPRPASKEFIVLLRDMLENGRTNRLGQSYLCQMLLHDHEQKKRSPMRGKDNGYEIA